MCKTDNAIPRIQDYIESYCSVLDIPCGTDLFKKRSYRRWAAYEICDLIMSRPFDNVDAIIEDFMFLMMACMSFDHSDQCNMVFNSALETAETLLIYLDQKEN